MSLAEKMTKPPVREKVVADSLKMIDEEVAGKGGLMGLAVKSAYAVVKAVKPRFVGEVVDSLLNEWVDGLEPLYGEWESAGKAKPLAAHLMARQSEVAEKLLHVTDSRAGAAKNANVKKLYEKLRPTAKKHVEAAVPRLAVLIERYAAK